jgi:hypothetical protein
MTEQVVIQTPNDGAAPAGHEEAMIAKVDGKEVPAEAPKAPEGESTERPAWLPEKFKSVEDMAKAYAELEAKQSGKSEEAPKAPEGEPKAEPNAAEAELAGKGLDLNEFSNEYSTSGTLSQESYDKLEKAGYPKAVVDQYIAGQQALAAQYESEVVSVAGGSEEFAKVQQWAAENLSDAEKIAYNKAIDSKDINQAKLAVQGITAKYQAQYPSEGTQIGGRATSIGEGYADLAEMKADMANPLYRESSAFREKVAQKIARSNIL